MSSHYTKQGRQNDQQWPGPPDPVLDGGPYTADVIKENDKPVAIKMTSEKDKYTGIQYTRTLNISDDTTHVGIDVTMTNIDTKPRRWGIWPVTQFDTSNRHGDGYNENYWTYCPINPDSMYYRGYNIMLGLVTHMSYKPDYENRMMRVQYDWRVGKIGMDSSAGWLATLDATDGYVFVHRFTYESGKPYPDDASVEFWMNGLGELVAWKSEVYKMPESLKDNPYIMESEILSPYAELDPGESYTFHYDWYTARVPANSTIADCSNIAITCKKLSAELCSGKLVLDGGFGVFYKGKIRLVLLDENDNEIDKVSDELPVTPLEPLVLAQMNSCGDIKIPENAAMLAVYLYDAKGQPLGQLAKTNIVRK